VRWQRPGDRGREDRRGWSTSYALTGAGAQERKTERDQDGNVKIDTDFVLDGDRLQKAVTVDKTQAVEVTTTQKYRYDDAGNVQRIYTTVDADGDAVISEPDAEDSAPQPAECEADDSTATTKTTRYCYDEFNRQVFSAGSGIEPYYVIYDGLDRRDRKVRLTQNRYAFAGGNPVTNIEFDGHFFIVAWTDRTNTSENLVGACRACNASKARPAGPRDGRMVAVPLGRPLVAIRRPE
jgi:hypothetical protein